jgi:hypothetical protein
MTPRKAIKLLREQIAMSNEDSRATKEQIAETDEALQTLWWALDLLDDLADIPLIRVAGVVPKMAAFCAEHPSPCADLPAESFDESKRGFTYLPKESP